MSCTQAKSDHPFIGGFLLVLMVIVCSSVLLGQDEEAPKADIFVGYQWLNPGGTVPTPFQPFNTPVPFNLPSVGNGAGAAYTYNFSRYLGLEGDLGGNWNKQLSDSTLAIGPRLMVRQEGMNFFLHTLLGGSRLDVYGLNAHTGIAAVLGGGIDIKATRLLSIRLFEADYVWQHQNFSKNVSPSFGNLRRPSLSGARLRGGLVFNFNAGQAVAPTANCTVQPPEVMVGEPITATANATGFNPKHTLTYSWTATGGKVSSKDNTASIDTNGIAGGNYTVTANISDPKMKKSGEASCSTNFSVKEPPKTPPIVSLSASPQTVQAGGTVNLTATCTSPDNVAVTVANWTATSGTVSGSGNTANLNTAGVPAGTVSISAACTDSRGLTTLSSTQVKVEPPPPPPVSPEVKQLEARLALHSIYFATGQPTAAKPSGGLLTSQQQTLLSLAADFQKYLQSKPDAHLILEGHADPRGSAASNQALSERRVERTKGFLIEHGVPVANIETKAFGDQHNLTADQVKDSVEQNPEVTTEERKRILRNMGTIILASNRRVDVTLSTTGETSVRQFPFNAADSLTLIGGREGAVKKTPRPAAKKRIPKTQ